LAHSDSDSISDIENLSQRADLQAAGMALALDAISASRLEPLLLRAAAVICEALGIAHLAIMIGSPGRSELTVRILRGWSDESVGDQTELSEAFAAWHEARVGRVAVPRVLDLTERPPDLLTEFFMRRGIQGGLTADISDGSGIFGLIGVYSANTRQFDDTERRFLAIVAAIVAPVWARERRECSARRAQILAALSRLAGGVAHELNNILTIILGNAQLLERIGGPLDEVTEISRDIQIATQRGSSLGADLLAFSRPLPEAIFAIDLCDLLAGMTKLWNHMAGSAMDLRMDAADTLWKVHVDPGQLIAALIGLAAHVHDVMRGKGCLRFYVCNRRSNSVGDRMPTALEPGGYVIFDITDPTGSINPEVVAEAFAPICAATRKGQNGATIEISSASMRLYLPAAEEAGTKGTLPGSVP